MKGAAAVGIREQYYSILLVSGSDKFNRGLLSALPEHRFYPVRITGGVTEARRELVERSYDIVIINTPLPDDFGTRLAIDLSGDIGLGVLMFVRSENFNEIYSQVAEYGILAVQKPATGQIVAQSLYLLCATRERLRRIEKKAASLEEKMEEIRLVNRAKWLLIDKEGMSEQDAHRLIEKRAMDKCVTKGSVAKDIIDELS